VPFADPRYAYYAPLGVLVTMYPTVAGSARTGAQMLAGLLLGIALGTAGTALTSLGLAPVGAIAFVAGIGVLFAGVRMLGPGKSWVAIAGLFVLLIGGGGDVGEFSVSYLVDVGFGVIVGVAANLLLFPPLYLTEAGRRLSELRGQVSDRMSAMADSLTAPMKDDVALADQARQLTTTLDAVREEVHEADESRKTNPRGRRRLAEDELNYRRLRALERTVFLVWELGDGLDRLSTDDAPRDSLATAIRDVADLVASPPDAEDSLDRLRRASDSVDALVSDLDVRAGGRASSIRIDLMVVDCLHRIMDASRPFVREPTEGGADR